MRKVNASRPRSDYFTQIRGGPLETITNTHGDNYKWEKPILPASRSPPSNCIRDAQQRARYVEGWMEIRITIGTVVSALIWIWVARLGNMYHVWKTHFHYPFIYLFLTSEIAHTPPRICD
jgi:hypothetical protein